MGKKKTVNSFNEATKGVKNNELEKEGIIVLNEGKVVEDEELDILGTSGDRQEFTIDTRLLDEELGISDVFKENGIGLMQIGNNEERKEKKKDKVYDKKKDANNKPDFKDIVEVYSMVLKNNEFEPIPYPFKNNDEFNQAFNQAVQLVDHIAISKFSRNNPELNLRDAFMHVFTIPDNDNIVNVTEKSCKGITTNEVEPCVCEAIEVIDDTKSNDEKLDSKLELKLKSILGTIETELNGVLEEVIANGNKEPEEVLKALLNTSDKLESTHIGKLVKAITGESISDIIRAEINGKNEVIDNIQDRLKNISMDCGDKLECLMEKVEKENMTDNEFIENLIDIIAPQPEEKKKEEPTVNRTTEYMNVYDSYKSSFAKFSQAKNSMFTNICSTWL